MNWALVGLCGRLLCRHDWLLDALAALEPLAHRGQLLILSLGLVVSHSTANQVALQLLLTVVFHRRIHGVLPSVLFLEGGQRSLDRPRV